MSARSLLVIAAAFAVGQSCAALHESTPSELPDDRGITPMARSFLKNSPDALQLQKDRNLSRFIYVILLSPPTEHSRERAALDAYLRCLPPELLGHDHKVEVVLPVTEVPAKLGNRDFGVYLGEVASLVDLNWSAHLYHQVTPEGDRRTHGVVLLDLTMPIQDAVIGDAEVIDLSSVPGPHMRNHFEQLRKYLTGVDPTLSSFALWAKDKLYYTEKTLAFMGKAFRVFATNDTSSTQVDEARGETCRL